MIGWSMHGVNYRLPEFLNDGLPVQTMYSCWLCIILGDLITTVISLQVSVVVHGRLTFMYLPICTCTLEYNFANYMYKYCVKATKIISCRGRSLQALKDKKYDILFRLCMPPLKTVLFKGHVNGIFISLTYARELVSMSLPLIFMAIISCVFILKCDVVQGTNCSIPTDLRTPVELF